MRGASEKYFGRLPILVEEGYGIVQGRDAVVFGMGRLVPVFIEPLNGLFDLF